MRLSGRVVAVCLVAVGVCAACSSSGDSGTSSSKTAPAASTAPPSSATPASSAATSSAPASPAAPTGTANRGPLTTAQARAALLTLAEVGPGLRATAVDNRQQPFPCTPNDPPPDKQVPPKSTVKASFVNATEDLQVTQQVSSYTDEQTAQQALAVGEKGLTCDQGTIGGQRVTIQGPVDVSGSFSTKVDSAEVWGLNGTGARQSIIVARMGQRIVALTFGEVAGANDSGFDAKGIADRAIAKVGAAG